MTGRASCTPGRAWRLRHAALRAALRAALLGAACGLALPAQAQNATAGKALYKLWCQVCHTPDPATAVAPFNNIMTAANNPARVLAAATVDPSQMGFIATTLTAADRTDLAAYLGSLVAGSAAIDVVEYYHAARDHYFMTGAAAEIADLDGGVHVGWARTGQQFKAWPVSATGTSPACRFYLPPAVGDSHFYSASPAECDAVRAAYPSFTFEAPGVFHIGLPDPVTGACAAGTLSVYRVWNQRADTNHRYTSSAAVRAQMLAAGWLAEGYGPGQVIMCAPQ
jgi:mono/diheme cytochrome c family protein